MVRAFQKSESQLNISLIIRRPTITKIGEIKKACYLPKTDKTDEKVNQLEFKTNKVIILERISD